MLRNALNNMDVPFKENTVKCSVRQVRSVLVLEKEGNKKKYGEICGFFFFSIALLERTLLYTYTHTSTHTNRYT